jgi:hypothetical protein
MMRSPPDCLSSQESLPPLRWESIVREFETGLERPDQEEATVKLRTRTSLGLLSVLVPLAVEAVAAPVLAQQSTRPRPRERAAGT